MATAKLEGQRSKKEKTTKEETTAATSTYAEQTHAGTKQKQNGSQKRQERREREGGSCSCSLVIMKIPVRTTHRRILRRRSKYSAKSKYHLPISPSICAVALFVCLLTILHHTAAVCGHERKSYSTATVPRVPGISLSFNINSTYYHFTHSYQTYYCCMSYRIRMYAGRAPSKSTW